MTTLLPAADEHVYDLFAAYTGLPVATVARCAENFPRFNQHAWEQCPGGTWETKARQFYNEANAYLFDLLFGSQSKQRRKQIYQQFHHWPWFEQAGAEVMEFGGGLGFWCSLLHESGRRVTYVDVDGPAAKFARWYFARCGQAIEQLVTPAAHLVLPEDRQWDLVFSDSVIEHVPDPAGTVERLARATRPGGVLYLIIDAHEVSPAFPMHQHVYLRDLLAGAPALRAMEHVLHDGDGLNVFEQRR